MQNNEMVIYDRIPQLHYDIQIEDMVFVISENTTVDNVPDFLQLYDALNIGAIVRTEVKTYDDVMFRQRGFRVVELIFSKARVPSQQQLKEFIGLVKESRQNKQNMAIWSISKSTSTFLLLTCVLCEDGEPVEQAIEQIRSQLSGFMLSPDQIQFLFQQYGRARKAVQIYQ